MTAKEWRSLDDCVVGKKYRVQYRYADQRRPDLILVGVYLGKDIYGGWQFDLRPTFGTTTILREADIRGVQEVERNVPSTTGVVNN